MTGYSSLIGLQTHKSRRGLEESRYRERSVILERPWENPASRVTGELTALAGARVMGEHRHPALVEQFTVLEGALSIFLSGLRRNIKGRPLWSRV